MVNVVATVQHDRVLEVDGDIEKRPHLQLESLQHHKKKILFVTSEFADLVKVGGLGDVSSALPRALGLHHDVRLLMPGYPEVINSGQQIRIIGRIPGHAGIPPCRIGRMDLHDGLIVYIVICPELYERDGNPYCDSSGRSWPDNHIRFARLGLVAAEIAAGHASISWTPELVHAHDWPAALAPAYIAWRGQHIPTLFTIHNLGHQGIFDADCSRELGIPPEAFTHNGVEFHGKLSFLKAGIVYASHITTVSKTYASEIVSPEQGCGMDGILKYKADQGLLTGIINGIDESWEPTADPHLLQSLVDTDWQGKAVHRRYVEQKFGLDPVEGPLFVVVSRIVQQKGIDLTREVASAIVEAGGQIAVIGRGEPELEASMLELAARYPGRIGVDIGFNELDARRMFAGSDFLLMPSRFEPCGLSQMYAQRFGSLPIATRTGGLADTIEDGVTGFLFNESNVSSYMQAIQRAFNVHQRAELLNAMRRMAMASPPCWQQSATPYNQLYTNLVNETAVLARTA